MGGPTNPGFQFSPCPELEGRSARHPVAIVGAGPVGLCAAVDLGQRGVPVVVLDARSALSDGSRAICWAKRTLEICDRLGTGAPLVAKGVTWSRGEVYLGDTLLYEFDLLPEPDHKRPAFINLQQYHFEEILTARALDLPTIDIRWQHSVSGVERTDGGVALTVDTPAGPYRLETDWLIAADGVRSTVRQALGLDFEGRVFHDRFLIADIRMQANLPAVRRFWFGPTFHDGQSTLMHRQADDVWRIDFQLGWDADPEEERKPANVARRLRRMLGADVAFELEWTSVYTFTCRRLAHFRHGRILFAGDSAHVVSPYGARGGNGGVQDVDNLCWKLALVVANGAPERLLDSYDAERVAAADENILNSTRSTDFLTPKSAVSHAFRDAVLDLAQDLPFARRLVNSGRLSTPATYADSPLSTPDVAAFDGGVVAGAPCADAPLAREGASSWLLNQLGGGFTLLYFAGPDGVPAGDEAQLRRLASLQPPVARLVVGPGSDLADVRGVAAARYDARPGTGYLIRPDQHVAARWRTLDAAAVADALARATGAMKE